MKVDISIVAPVYNEEESVPHLVRKVYDVMTKTSYTWELICIDDGSSDKSAEIMAKMALDYPQFKPVFFRRNYGQTAAMQAGFDHAKGDVVITMDADLQNDPADIPAMMKKMDETGADIVAGWRKNRKDKTISRKIPSKIANKLVAKVTGIDIHDTGCSLKAFKKEVLEGVRIYGEMHRFIPAVMSQNGAKVEEMVVRHHARQFGETKYGIDRTFRVLLDLILLGFFRKYINRPMHAFGMAGLICLTIGGASGTYLLALKIMGNDIGGRPLLLVAVIMVLMGVQLIGMGILGELMMRMYHEPKGRRQYVTKEVKAKPVSKKIAKKKPAPKKPVKRVTVKTKRNLKKVS